MRFGRSKVHAWGLFSARNIAAEEFLVEYVGELIRSELADRCVHKREACQSIAIRSGLQGATVLAVPTPSPIWPVLFCLWVEVTL